MKADEISDQKSHPDQNVGKLEQKGGVKGSN